MDETLSRQAAARLEDGDFLGAAESYMAAIAAAPQDGESWLGLALAFTLAGRAGLVPDLARRRHALLGDGASYLHDALTVLMSYGRHDDVLAVHAAVPAGSDLCCASLYFVGCVHLLRGDDDAAFAAFRRLKPLLAQFRDSLPIGPDHRFNIAYRQATLVEDWDYLDTLDDARVATMTADLPPLERVGAWRHGSAAATMLAACDGRYMEHFGADYLRSLDAVAEGLAIHLHLVEPKPAAVDLARQVGASLSRNVLNLSVEAGNPHRSGAYYACSRFLAAGEVMAHAGRPLIVTDIDITFIRSPLDVATAAAECDFATFVHGGFGPCSRLPAVLTWFAATPSGQAALTQLRRFILSKLDVRWPLNWMLDQAGLMTVRRWLGHCEPAARIGTLNDLTGGPFAALLQCHGSEDDKQVWLAQSSIDASAG